VCLPCPGRQYYSVAAVNARWSRHEIDRKYEYKYSQLTHVFGRLLHEQRLYEEELLGLREDKLKLIRSFAKFLAEDAA
jgi:hypothetical protein